MWCVMMLSPAGRIQTQYAGARLELKCNADLPDSILFKVWGTFCDMPRDFIWKSLGSDSSFICSYYFWVCTRDMLCFCYLNACWNLMCLFTKCWVTHKSLFLCTVVKLRQSHCHAGFNSVIINMCARAMLLSSDSVGAQCERSGPHKVWTMTLTVWWMALP